MNEKRKVEGSEICIFCNGEERITKTWCYWLQANAHCRCCHKAFEGKGNVPCLKMRGNEE